MPTYEYRCDKCGFEFEREQRITEDPIKSCPKCKAQKARRLISATSFVLKGGGWYSDLYSSSKGGKSGGSESPAPASSSDSSGDSSGKSSGDSSKSTKSDAGGSKPSKTKGGAKASASA
jgi:putative FmdB family regulatory protein